jgi:hypothetical protein
MSLEVRLRVAEAETMGGHGKNVLAGGEPDTLQSQNYHVLGLQKSQRHPMSRPP